MASTITNTAINEAILSIPAKQAFIAINNGTLGVNDVDAMQFSNAEKATLRDLINGVATRQTINARSIDLVFKNVALAIANV